MFLKNQIYHHIDVPELRFLCLGTTESKVLLAVETPTGFQEITPINLEDADEYLELEAKPEGALNPENLPKIE